MNPSKSEKGQALIFVALAAILLFGFAALAIDVTRVLADRRNAQNAADTSAIAAALAKIRKQDYVAAATNRASSNGYQTDANSTVTVNLCSDSGVTCAGLPANATKSEYIKVQIVSTVPMTFARVLGRVEMTNRVDAIARAQTALPPNAASFGAGMVAVKSDNSDDCIKTLGTSNVSFHNSGVFVNCTGSSALTLTGNASLYMDGDAQVAGCSNDTSFPIAGPGNITCNVPQQTVDANTFASLPTTLPAPICTNPGAYTGTSITPGNFTGAVIINDGTIFNPGFFPGDYCFPGGLFLGNQTVDISGAGNVKWVLTSSVTLAGTANLDSLEIYATNANFTIKNTGQLTVNHFRFFGIGNSSLIIQGGTLTSNDAYIYSEAGQIDINAQAKVNVHAPPAGDPFAGYLMYLPWDNPNSFELNGGTGNVWTGTLLMPHTQVTYNGGSNFQLHGQLIGYTIKINGGAMGDIYYEPGPNAPELNAPIIQLTK